jgi:hypothetical protein
MEELSFEFLIDPFEELNGTPRRLHVATGFRGDYALRDGFAHGLLRERFANRSRTEWGYAPVHTSETEMLELKPGTDLLFNGRSNILAKSRYQGPAAKVAKKTQFTFIDDGTGACGDSIRIGSRVFPAKVLNVPGWPHRRCIRDFAVLVRQWQHFAGEERVLWAIQGITGFGTLLLSAMLLDDALRQTLRKDVRELVQSNIHQRPERATEILVRFDVDGLTDLENVLNRIRPGAPLPARFEVEAVAVARRHGGPEIFVRRRMLELVRDSRRKRGGWLLDPETEEQVHLTPAQYDLMVALGPNRDAAVSDLVSALGIGDNTLQQRVSGLNRVLEAEGLEWSLDHLRKEKRYRLVPIEEARGKRGRSRRGAA